MKTLEEIRQEMKFGMEVSQNAGHEERCGRLAGLAKAELLYEQTIGKLDGLFENAPAIRKSSLRAERAEFCKLIDEEIDKLSGKTGAFSNGMREAFEWVIA